MVRYRRALHFGLAGFVAVCGVVTGGVWLLVQLPQYQVSLVQFTPTATALERAMLVNEYRKTLAQVIGGVFVIVGALSGAIFTWTQILVARDGQFTHRFTEAIRQLGDATSVAVRLGGIYALERLARDSAKDHWAIVETLSAFVRENATKRTEAPRTDIVAALTVLARRRDEPGPVDLVGAHLEGVCLQDAYLNDADLRGAYFDAADLEGAHLEAADLRGAHLEGANLRGAHLEDAFLAGAHLRAAVLQDAYLDAAYLREAHLEGADLRGARLRSSDLRGAHLEGADLRRARLTGAFLMDRAHLEEANLTIVHLEEADLRGAHLEAADLRGAHLEGADLRGAHLTGAVLVDATASPSTQWPDGFQPELVGVAGL